MLMNATMVTIVQYTSVSKQQSAHLKLTKRSMSIISRSWGEKLSNKGQVCSEPCTLEWEANVWI